MRVANFSRIVFVLTLQGVLGATGSVGQRFILLLALHPHLDLQAVSASERSAGKKYKDATRWKQAFPVSDRIGELVVRICMPEEFSDCDIIFSGLDSEVAGDVGECKIQLWKLNISRPALNCN